MSSASRGYGEFRQGGPVVASAMLGIAFGFGPIPFYSTGSFAPSLAAAFGWGMGEIMSGLTVMTFTFLVAGPAVGMLSDRYGVRRVVLIAVPLLGLSLMGFAFNPGDLRLYYLNWLVASAVGAATLPITWTRAVNNWFEVRKGLALGLALLGTGLFGYFAKPFLAWSIEALGWRGSYIALGALPILIAWPAAFLWFRDRDDGMTVAERRQAAEAQAAQTSGMTLAETLRDYRFWIIALAFVPIAFAVGGPVPNMEKILEVSGFRGEQIVTLASFIGLAVILGRILGGWLIDRFWAPAVALVLLTLPAIACVLLGQGVSSFALAAASVALIGFAAGVEYDLLAFLVARYFGMKSYGAIYGALYAFFALGSGLAPAIFGAVYDDSGSFFVPLMVAAGFFIFGALLLLLLGPYRSWAPRGADADQRAAAERAGEGRGGVMPLPTTKMP